MGGSCFAGNSTSTTGPIICTTRPVAPTVGAVLVLDVAILSFCSSLLPMKAKKLEGLKASQDTTGAKVAPNRSSDLLDPARPPAVPANHLMVVRNRQVLLA